VLLFEAVSCRAFQVCVLGVFYSECCRVLQGVAERCSMLQCVAACSVCCRVFEVCVCVFIMSVSPVEKGGGGGGGGPGPFPFIFLALLFALSRLATSVRENPTDHAATVMHPKAAKA